MLNKSEEARKLLEKAGYAWLEKTIKNFDRFGASVRKYLESSNRPLDKIYSKLGDIQEKMNKIPQALDNMLKVINDGFAEINRKLDAFKGKTKDLYSPFLLFIDDTQKVEKLDKVVDGVAIGLMTLGGVISVVQPELLPLAAAFAAVGAAIWLLNNAFKYISRFLEQSGLRKVFDDLALTLGETFKAVYDVLKNVAISLKDTFTDVFKQISDVVINTFISLKDTFLKFWGEFYKGLSSAWGAVETFFNEKIAWLKSVFDISDLIKDYGSQIINSLKEGALAAWSNTKKFFDDKVDWIKDKLQFRKSPPFSIIYGYGTGFMEAFCQGIIDKAPLLQSSTAASSPCPPIYW
jgi:hypothetical protein